MIPHILPTYNRADLAFERGEGTWAITADGTRYLDLAAGIAVNSLGHAHPALVAALTEQAGKIWHVSNLYQIPQQEALADRLVETSFADTAFFTNSGTEAAELAIKMTRKHHAANGTPRAQILTVEGAFHGRSTGAIAASGAAKMVEGYGPLMPGFQSFPLDDLDGLIATITEETCAVMIEPIQGEGGIRVIPDASLRALREACDATGALLIFDEVQCGVGRTGKLWAHEWTGVTPDIMMIAKGIGGGFPLGGVLATEHAAKGMTAGTHGTTYGGNPLACAVGIAVMDIIDDDAFLAEVRSKAGALSQGLEGLVAAHPDVFEGVRGAGLMLGLKCRKSPADIARAGYAEHILTVPAADDVLRLLPPLTISMDEIAEALARLDRAATRLEP